MHKCDCTHISDTSHDNGSLAALWVVPQGLGPGLHSHKGSGRYSDHSPKDTTVTSAALLPSEQPSDTEPLVGVHQLWRASALFCTACYYNPWHAA